LWGSPSSPLLLPSLPPSPRFHHPWLSHTGFEGHDIILFISRAKKSNISIIYNWNIFYQHEVTYRSFFWLSDQHAKIQVESVMKVKKAQKMSEKDLIDITRYVCKLPNSQSLKSSFFVSKCRLIYITSDLNSRVYWSNWENKHRSE